MADKKQKRMRKPSAYNLFIGEQIRAGKSFAEAVQAWNEREK
jgi:hypothetical protein